MTNIEEFIHRLITAGIKISMEEGKLIIHAKDGVLTSTLKNELIKNKEKLIEILTKNIGPCEPEITANEASDAPLTFAQQGLWLIDQAQNGTPEYNMALAFDVLGYLDAGLIERIFKTIVERHEILRSVYTLAEGYPRQYIRQLDEIDFRVTYDDLSHLEVDVQNEEIDRRIAEDLITPFVLGKDVMLRVTYLNTGNETGALLVNIHHIASDGWSLELLKKEFFTLYHAYSEGKANPLSKLGIQYADYAIWQRKWFQQDSNNSQLDYWQEQLSELPLIHNLETDFPRPAVKKFEGKIIFAQLPKETAESIGKLARRHELTPFMLLHAALALVLSRHSNSHDIVAGTPAGSRLQSAIEPLIGFFVNTLVLRVDTDHSNLADYFSHVRQVHLEAQSNRDTPFEQIVERLDLLRSKAYTPLFQIMMRTDFGSPSEEQNTQDVVTTSKLKLNSLIPDKVISKFDLDVRMSLQDSGVMIEWIYDTHLFTKKHVEQLNTHFCRVLTEFAKLETDEASMSQSINGLPILSDSEVDHLLKTLNPKVDVNYKPYLVHQLFEQQVARTPDKTAVTFNGNELSYTEVNGKANQLVHYLTDKGIGKGDYVGIYCHRSLSLIVATLAVIKCGAAYIPFNPENTAERNSQIIRESGLKMVLVQPELEHGLHETDIDCVHLWNNLDEADWLNEYESATPSINPGKEDSVYVMYTSGSTGTPKGVEITHEGLQEYLLYGMNNYYAEHLDGSLLLTSHAFDIGNPSIYLPLLLGGKVDLLSNNNTLEALKYVLASPTCPNYLLRMTPNHVFALLELLPKDIYLSKHVFVIGGEAFSTSLAKELQTRFPSSQIYNHYGPTEAVVGCTIYDVTSQTQWDADVVPIGSPMDNVEAYVLNSEMQLLPKSVVGELFVGRLGLAKGYLNQPELTSKHFVDNPFYDASNPLSSPRLYKTGDLVRYLPDDSLMFVGRCDDQVKIRGYRVELEEIEHQLTKISVVQSCLVLAHEDSLKQKSLVAYVVVDNKSKQTSGSEIISQIKKEIGKQLPTYMIPGFFVLVDEWTLSANGKIDKKALPEPGSSLQNDFVKAETGTEIALVEIWSELLNVEHNLIGTTSNFFELGGHSLLTVRLMTLIKNEFGVEPTLSTLFDINSLGELASSIDSAIIIKRAKAQMEISKSEMEWL